MSFAYNKSCLAEGFASKWTGVTAITSLWYISPFSPCLSVQAASSPAVYVLTASGNTLWLLYVQTKNQSLKKDGSMTCFPTRACLLSCCQALQGPLKGLHQSSIHSIPRPWYWSPSSFQWSHLTKTGYHGLILSLPDLCPLHWSWIFTALRPNSYLFRLDPIRQYK